MAEIYAYEGISFSEIENNINQYEQDRAFENKAALMESCMEEDHIVRSGILEENK